MPTAITTTDARGTRVDSIPLGIIDGVGVTGVLAILYWMLSTGRLVVGSTLEDTRRQRDAAEERARAADERAREARRVALQATEALRDIAKRDDLGVALLRSIEKQSSGDDKELH